MKRSYSDSIVNAIKSFLDSLSTQYSFDEEKGKFKFKYYNTMIIINVNDDDFFAYTTRKMATTEETLPLLYKYINKISEDCYFANFVYDKDEGYLVCQCYINCFNYIPSREIIEESILSVAHRMDCYVDIFFDISKWKSLPDDMLESIATFEFRRTY